MTTMHSIIVHILLAATWSATVYMVLVGLSTLTLLGGALASLRTSRRARSQFQMERSQRIDNALRISLVVPAHNEAATIEASVRALLTLHYAQKEVLVVDDGSTDETLAVLVARFDLAPVQLVPSLHQGDGALRGLYRSMSYPELMVATRVNGGKADALNMGLHLASGSLVCMLDADTLVEPDALDSLVREFDRDDSVVAAGGMIRVANGASVQAGRISNARVPRRLLPGTQTVEYLRAFLIGRLGWNGIGGGLIVSGAFGLFRRQSLLDVGGFTRGAIAEDMEVVLKLHRHAAHHGKSARVAFVPDAIAWTESPGTLEGLCRQRERWQRGLADSLWRHRAMLGNANFGSTGTIVFPYFVVAELLAPVVELFGVFCLIASASIGVLDRSTALQMMLVSLGGSVLVSMSAVVMDELTNRRPTLFTDRLWSIVWSVAEAVVVRPLISAARLTGVVRFLLGRTDWARIERRGFRGEHTRVCRALFVAMCVAAAMPGSAHGQSPDASPQPAITFTLSGAREHSRAAPRGETLGDLRIARAWSPRVVGYVRVSRAQREALHDDMVGVGQSTPATKSMTVGVDVAKSITSRWQPSWSGSAWLNQRLGAGWSLGLETSSRSYRLLQGSTAVRLASLSIARDLARYHVAYTVAVGQPTGGMPGVSHRLLFGWDGSSSRRISILVSDGSETERITSDQFVTFTSRSMALWGDERLSEQWAVVYALTQQQDRVDFGRSSVSLGLRHSLR